MASRNASFHERGVVGILLAPLKWCFIATLLLSGLIISAWVIDWIFVFKVWPAGISHLQSILEQDLARTHRLPSWCDDLASFAVGAANALHSLMFGMTGIQDMGTRFAEGAALSIPDSIMRETYIAHHDAVQVAMLGTQLVGVRLAILTTAVPLFILVYTVGLTDGLVQRAVRRVSGGRESASLYHRAKYGQLILVTTSASLSVLLPASFDPGLVLLPGMAVAGLLVRMQWACYKKHL